MRVLPFFSYGAASAALSFLPCGDALPFIAGIMRVHPLLMLALCGLGKGARYAVIVIGV